MCINKIPFLFTVPRYSSTDWRHICTHLRAGAAAANPLSITISKMKKVTTRRKTRTLLLCCCCAAGGQNASLLKCLWRESRGEAAAVGRYGHGGAINVNHMRTVQWISD